MRFALVTSTLLLVTSIILIIFFTTIFRFWRNKTDAKKLAYRKNLRELLVKFLSEDLNPGELSSLRKIRSSQLEELSDALLSKVKGRAKDMLISFLASRGTIEKAINRTRRPGYVGRCRAAVFLGNIGLPEARMPLQNMLTDHRRDVRITAARSLGQLANPKSVPALLSALDHSHREVPFGTVLLALLRIGAGGITPLREGLKNGGESTRALAAEVLGLIGSLESTADLIDIMQNDTSVDVRIRSARALGRLGSEKAILPLRRIFEEDSPAPLQVVSCRALADIGDPVAIPWLMDLMDHGSYQLARAASAAMANLGERGEEALRNSLSLNSIGSNYAQEALVRMHARSLRDTRG